MGCIGTYCAKITNKVKSVWITEEQPNPNQFCPAVYDEETGTLTQSYTNIHTHIT